MKELAKHSMSTTALTNKVMRDADELQDTMRSIKEDTNKMVDISINLKSVLSGFINL